MSLEHVIKDVDSIAWSKLDDPSSESYAGKDVVNDPEFNEYVRTVLMGAFSDAENNAMAKQIAAYYQNGRYDTTDQIKLYNGFMKTNFKGETAAIIDTPKLFGRLTMDQKVGFGIYMTSKGELKFD